MNVQRVYSTCAARSLLSSGTRSPPSPPFLPPVDVEEARSIDAVDGPALRPKRFLCAVSSSESSKISSCCFRKNREEGGGRASGRVCVAGGKVFYASNHRRRDGTAILHTCYSGGKTRLCFCVFRIVKALRSTFTTAVLGLVVFLVATVFVFYFISKEGAGGRGRGRGDGEERLHPRDSFVRILHRALQTKY